MKRLPDAEFEIMKVLWDTEPPMTANRILEGLNRQLKVQTIMTLLIRLGEKGFVKTEKNGGTRTYTPIISRDEYLRYETGHFMEQYHEGSFISLFNALHSGQKISADEVKELRRLLEQQED